MFVTHLKSKYVDPNQSKADQDKDRRQSDIRRWKQASTVANIVRSRFPNPATSRFVIAGDFNDTPDSNLLAPLLQNQNLQLIDVTSTLPQADRWTHYWKKEDHYSQLDYLLISPGLYPYLKLDSVHVVQKRFIGGSDHRPLYATLEF